MWYPRRVYLPEKTREGRNGSGQERGVQGNREVNARRSRGAPGQLTFNSGEGKEGGS